MRKENKIECQEELPLFVGKEGFAGVAYGDTHDFEWKESFVAKLEVIRCKKCGRESIAWERVHKET